MVTLALSLVPDTIAAEIGVPALIVQVNVHLDGFVLEPVIGLNMRRVVVIVFCCLRGGWRWAVHRRRLRSGCGIVVAAVRRWVIWKRRRAVVGVRCRG
jgi:hypothetical protein